MSPVTNEITQTSNFNQVETALELVLGSENLEDLCRRVVLNPATHEAFVGAHVLLNTNGKLSHDSGFGIELPINHLEIAKSAIASSKLEFRDETQQSPALIAVPFLRNNYAEAIGILICAPETQANPLEPELHPILTKLTGFYLATKIGLDN